MLTSLAASAGVSAQAKGVPLGEYQVHVTRASAGPVLSAANAGAANVLLEQVLPIVRANAAAGASPRDMCMRLSSHVYPSLEKGPAIQVAVSFPIVIEGQCYNLTTSAVKVIVNDLRPLLHAKLALPGPGTVEHEPMFQPLRPSASPTVHPRYGRVIVIAKPGVPAFLPLPKEQYLRALERAWEASLTEFQADRSKLQTGMGGAYERWVNGGRAEQIAANERSLKEAEAYMTKEQLAELRKNLEASIETTGEALRQMSGILAAQAPRQDAAGREIQAYIEAVRAELARLTPTERQLPTCLVVETPWVSAGPRSCPVDRQPLVPNPAYWDPALPASAAQLILVEVGEIELHRNDLQSEPARRATAQQAIVDRIVETLDYAALARLIR